METPKIIKEANKAQNTIPRVDAFADMNKYSPKGERSYKDVVQLVINKHRKKHKVTGNIKVMDTLGEVWNSDKMNLYDDIGNIKK